MQGDEGEGGEDESVQSLFGENEPSETEGMIDGARVYS